MYARRWQAYGQYSTLKRRPAAARLMSAAPPSSPPTAPHRNRTRLVLVVVIVAAILVVGYVLMVLFVLNATQLQPGGKPVMTLSAPSVQVVGTSWYVAAMTTPTDHAKFQVRLLVNGTPTSMAAMAAGSQPAQLNLSTGGFIEVYYVTWFDATQDGLVSRTDTFTVSGLDGFRAATDYSFQILWSDSTPIVSSNFST